MIQTREDGKNRGLFYGIDAPEFSTHASGQIISLNGPKGTDADHMAITYVTDRATASYNEDSKPADPNHSGHYRDPLAMSDGTLVAAHTVGDRGREGVGQSDDLALRLPAEDAEEGRVVLRTGPELDPRNHQVSQLLVAGFDDYVQRPALGATAGGSALPHRSRSG